MKKLLLFFAFIMPIMVLAQSGKYYSTTDIFNKIFSSPNLALQTKYKAFGDVLNLVYNPTANALNVRITGLPAAGFDTTTFLAKPHTWSRNNTFSANILYSNVATATGQTYGLVMDGSVIKKQLLPSGSDRSSDANYNTIFGTGAGGSYALRNCTYGYESGYSLTSGGYNVLVGVNTGYHLDSGHDNMFFGYHAGYWGTSEHNNISIGSYAGKCNIAGSQNVVIGREAGYNNLDSGNVFIGHQSGKLISTGHYNLFLGFHSGGYLTKMSYRIIIGTKDYGSLILDTTKSPIYINDSNTTAKIYLNGSTTITGTTTLTGLSGGSAQKILGITSTGLVDSLATTQMSGLGLVDLTTAQTLSSKILDESCTLPIWKNITGTTLPYINDSTFSYTGTWKSLSHYYRTSFQCLGVEVTGNAGIVNDSLFVGHTPKLKNGDMIMFTNGTLPTVSGSPPLEKNRLYWVVGTGTLATDDSVCIAEVPNGTKINFTSTGTVVKKRAAKIGYIYNITSNAAGTTITATVHRNYALTATDSCFKVMEYKKLMDYQYDIYTGVGAACYPDATNPQGRRLLNFPTDAYLISVTSQLGTAATGTGHCSYNIYSGATPLFTTNPDLVTRSVWNPSANKWLQEIPDVQFITMGSNITVRNILASGTVQPAYLQLTLTIIPARTYNIP